MNRQRFIANARDLGFSIKEIEFARRLSPYHFLELESQQDWRLRARMDKSFERSLVQHPRLVLTFVTAGPRPEGESQKRPPCGLPRVRTRYSHQMTAAAKLMAPMKFWMLRSKRVAMRRQSLKRQNMRSTTLRCL